MRGERRHERAGDKNIPRLRVVEIHYVSTSDADSRLSRAVDILLGSAVRDLEVGINAKEEVEASQDSPLTEAMERKDES